MTKTTNTTNTTTIELRAARSAAAEGICRLATASLATTIPGAILDEVWEEESSFQGIMRRLSRLGADSKYLTALDEVNRATFARHVWEIVATVNH